MLRNNRERLPLCQDAKTPQMAQREMRHSVGVQHAKHVRGELPKGLLVYLGVFLSGGGVLVVEIAGTRVLAPTYGATVHLWSALIAVTLCSLCIGNLMGGRLARKPQADRKLGAAICTAGVCILLIPLQAPSLIKAGEHLGYHAGLLALSLSLFAPPLILLGTVVPLSFETLSKATSPSSHLVGKLSAASTFGAVAFALLTGFLFLPYVGVRALFGATGAIVTLAGFPLLLSRSRPAHMVAGLAAVLALAVAAAMPSEETSQVAYYPSSYGELAVTKTESATTLWMNGIPQTSIQPSSGRSNMPYVHLCTEVAGRPGPGKAALVLGMGGGSLASSLAGRGWSVDAVEVDRAVADLAKTTFRMPESITVHQGDARRYIRESTCSYDLVVVDAFNAASLPAHMTSREFFAEVRDAMKPGAQLVLNVIAASWSSKIVSTLTRTLKTCFDSVRAYPLELPTTPGNILLVASRGILETPGVFVSEADEHIARACRLALANSYDPVTTGDPIITDNKSRIEVLTGGEQVEIVRHMRKLSRR